MDQHVTNTSDGTVLSFEILYLSFPVLGHLKCQSCGYSLSYPYFVLFSFPCLFSIYDISELDSKARFVKVLPLS